VTPAAALGVVGAYAAANWVAHHLWAPPGGRAGYVLAVPVLVGIVLPAWVLARRAPGLLGLARRDAVAVPAALVAGVLILGLLARGAPGAEPARLTFLEQPVPMGDLAGMAAVARASSVPILADEGIFTAQDVLAHAREGAARIVSVKLLKAGGFTGALRAVHAAESVHLPLHLTGKVAESSIATAALVHLAVAVRELEYGLGVTNHYLSADVVAEPLRGVGGHVRPPEGPGLGVEVDEARVARLRTPG